MNKFNLHTHTNYCDGKAKAEDFVMKALLLNFTELGFSGHAPMNFKYGYEMSFVDIDKYVAEVRELQSKYASELNILLALEADYINGLTPTFDDFKENYQLDYIIGAVHLVRNPENGKLWFIEGKTPKWYDEGISGAFDGDFKKGVTTYFSQMNDMVASQKPDIIAHLDKISMHNQSRWYKTDENWYLDEVVKSLQLIKKHGSVIEVNTRGKYKGKTTELSPEIPLLKLIHEMRIPVTISTDAHHPDELDLLWDETARVLYEYGFRKIYTFKNKDFYPVELKF